MILYPLKFNNIFLEKIWGGDALLRHLCKPVPKGGRVGESWELSEHKNGESVIRDGALKGKSLSQVVKEYPEALLGQRMAKKYGKFPLLFKFIDAQDKLSIQVHPDDVYAREHENDLGKTEAWYVVHAEPGAKLICGLKAKLKPDEVRTALAQANLETRLNEFEVTAGDCIFVPAGTVHAIEAGVVIYEVQEVSDITYRLYDWGRNGDDGKPRDLHVEESLRVMNFDDTKDHRTRPVRITGNGYEREVLAGCDYFVLEKYYITGETERQLPDRFEVMTVTSGRGSVQYGGKETPVQCGETLLLPAEGGRYRIRAGKDGLTCLLSWVPDNRKAAARELAGQGIVNAAMEKLGGLI